jgi:hypothetical protein
LGDQSKYLNCYVRYLGDWGQYLDSYVKLLGDWGQYLDCYNNNLYIDLDLLNI